MFMEEKMILAHQAGRALAHECPSYDERAEAEARYSTVDERIAFVAGFRGERIRYLDWLKSRRTRW
jgi:hypothetical protein